MRRLKLCSALSCLLLLCVMSLSLVLPLAGPGVLHLEHQVVFDGASVYFPHAGSDHLQQRGQTPDLIQERQQELLSILNAHTHTHTQKV